MTCLFETHCPHECKEQDYEQCPHFPEYLRMEQTHEIVEMSDDSKLVRILVRR